MPTNTDSKGNQGGQGSQAAERQRLKQRYADLNRDLALKWKVIPEEQAEIADLQRPQNFPHVDEMRDMEAEQQIKDERRQRLIRLLPIYQRNVAEKDAIVNEIPAVRKR